MAGRRWKAAGAVIAAAMIVAALTALTGAFPARDWPEAQGGVLDLRAWDGGQETLLQGEWEVWWDVVRSPAELPVSRSAEMFRLPDRWNGVARPDGTPRGGFGAATFRLRVLLPENREQWGLRFGNIKSAAALWIDGQLVAEAGRPAEDAMAEVARPAYFLVPLPSGREIEVVLAVSNHFHSEGGVHAPVRMGPLQAMTHERDRFRVLSAIVLGGPLVLAVFMAAVSLGDRSPRGGLLFGSVAIVVALRHLCISRAIFDLWPGGDWGLVYRLEYLTIYLFPALYGHLLRNFFPQDIPRALVNALTVIALAGVFLQFSTPVHVFTLLRDPATLMVLASVLCFLVFICRAWRRRRQGAALAAAGVALVAIGVTNDFLLYALRIRSVDLTQIGIVGFLLMNGLVLGRRSIAASRILERLNTDLERQVAERTRDLSEATLRAERQAEVRANLLAVLSHEIRTHVNGMLGLLRAMRRGPLSAEQGGRLDTVLQEGGELVTLLTDVLGAARAEVDQLPLRLAPFDPAALVQGVASLMRPTAAEKGLGVEVDLAPDLPAAVLGNGGRIRQILVNLTTNAIKYSSSGTIRLAASFVDGHLLVSVSDRGPGLLEHEIEDLFNAFTRRAEGDDGSGLGLFICRRLAQAMGARLTVNSVVGQGSTFRLSVPVELASASPCSTPAGAAPVAPRRLNVLVVDDVALNRLVLLDILDQLGHRGRVASSGLEAVAVAESDSEVDIVLLDIRLPDIDGVEVARRIRAGRRGTTLPLIAVTANAFDQDIARYRREGFVDVLVKPVTEEAVADSLVLAVGAEAAGQPASGSHLAGRADMRERLASELRRTAADIRAAAEAGDWRRVAAIAHRMAGTAANFGHADLAAAARALENATAGGEAADIGPLLTLVEQAYRVSEIPASL